MKSFSEMINTEEHKNGTYISVKLDKDSSKKLDKWASDNKIPNLIDQDEYHCTVIYSRKGIPASKSYDLNLPVEAKIDSWKIFKTQQNTNCLVGVLNSNELKKHHSNIMKEFKGTYDFPEYIPHITLSYNYGNIPVPAQVPDFDLSFNDKEFKALDPEYSPKKKD